jgi:hypothetical protein
MSTNEWGIKIKRKELWKSKRITFCLWACYLRTMLSNPKATSQTLATPLQPVALQARDVLKVVGPFGFPKSELLV